MSVEYHAGPSQRLFSQTVEDVLKLWARRGAGLALGVVIIGAWAALISWSQNDPSLSVNTAEPTRNLLGAPGAVVADFLLHTLGLAVVFALIAPLALSAELTSTGKISELRKKLAFSGLATIAIAGGASALPLVEGWPLQTLGFGGILGDIAYGALSSVIAPIFSVAAGAIAGLTFFMAGFWALSKALCLERLDLLDVSFSSVAPAALTFRPFRRATRVADAPSSRAEVSLDQPRDPVIGDERIEPEPPAWKMDDRMEDFRDLTSETSRPTPASLPFGAARDGEAAGDSALQPVLLDEDTSDDVDDLPNVLRRERAKIQGNAGAGVQLMPAGADAPTWQPARQAAAGSKETPAPHAKRPPPIAAAKTPLSHAGYRRPSLNHLTQPASARPSADTSPAVLQGKARMLEDVLADFRIKGTIRDVRPGPVITLFELEPARGTKSSRVIALADDVARSMSAVSARISVIPGRNAIGIELPNTRRETFGLKELVDSPAFRDSTAKLPLVLGKGIGGEPILADLARMPHLLVAGTTGSGKSVGVNAMILSLIYRLGPDRCRFLMIDPKMLELSAYNGIPHLLSPVITDPQKAVTALAWAVGEMEERYKRMAELGVRSIDAYNKRIEDAKRGAKKFSRTVQTGFDPHTGEPVFEERGHQAETLPHIVIIVDEFADLMAVAGKEIEGLVQRLAQMARAAGIHMIMATQRPSVDVVTGTIKANFPTRISYRVASRIDSRTILGEQGAEQLLGQGDMLFLAGTGDIERVHGPFVSDEEVEQVTSELRQSYPDAQFEDVIQFDDEGRALAHSADPSGPEQGDLFQDAVALVVKDRKASTSYLQRKLSIGYNRAADLIDRMEAEGVIGPADHAGRRDILVD
jgi:S-DNA-T family DNA segregation ATPase FtsK/SpoIIIE